MSTFLIHTVCFILFYFCLFKSGKLLSNEKKVNTVVFMKVCFCICNLYYLHVQFTTKAQYKPISESFSHNNENLTW